MTNMIKTEEMHDQRIPIATQKFRGNMASHIIVDFGEILVDVVCISAYVNLRERSNVGTEEQERRRWTKH